MKSPVSFKRRALLSAAVVLLPPTLYPAVFDKAAVAASTPEAVRAGVSILRGGGNAVDAAAAVAFALMVTDPAMCSLAGRAQILLRLKEGTLVGMDGATVAPGLAEEPARAGYGYKTSAVPGSPAALEQLVARYGTLPLRTVIQPAVDLARDGFLVNGHYAGLFRSAQQYLRLYPGSAKHFLKSDGTPYAEGERFYQPALARALELMAAEPGAFYRGKIAAAIVADMTDHGGLVTKADLARYRVLPGTLVEGNYRGFRIVSRGDQCDGASVIEMLQILEQFPLSTFAPRNPDYLHLVAQSVYLGLADEELLDWKQVSPYLAARRGREIDPARALAIPAKPKRAPHEGETTHLSVVDEQGNAVAMTLSIGPNFGSKAANPEFGFFYAYSYAMNEDPVPYKRDKTSQSPTIVFKDGSPFLVLGSAGSDRIPSSIVQVISNVIDHRMPLEEALASPRVFLTDTGLRLEAPDYPKATLARLASLGYKTFVYKDLDGYFGKVHAILIDEVTHKLHASFDPRGFGAAGGF